MPSKLYKGQLIDLGDDEIAARQPTLEQVKAEKLRELDQLRAEEKQKLINKLLDKEQPALKAKTALIEALATVQDALSFKVK